MDRYGSVGYGCPSPLSTLLDAPPSLSCPEFRSWIRIMPGQAFSEFTSKHQGTPEMEKTLTFSAVFASSIK